MRCHRALISSRLTPVAGLKLGLMGRGCLKLGIGNACWHAFHVQHVAVGVEAGFFTQEGLDVEIVHAKINPKAIESSRPGGERYDEVGTVVVT